MDGHLLAHTEIVPITSQLVTHLLDGEASPEEGAGLTILREDQILVAEGGSCADARGLLTELCHVERDSSLALGRIVHNVGLVDHHHLVEHL